MTVLVIDDEDDIRLLARVGLAAGGFDVVTAADGLEGIQLARSRQPDVILLDVMMPGLDGYATFAALRADPATSSIPVIFLTAKNRHHTDDRLAGQPRVGLIHKPFVPRELGAQISRFVGGRKPAAR